MNINYYYKNNSHVTYKQKNKNPKGEKKMISKAILFGIYAAVACSSFFATLFIIIFMLGIIYGFFSTLIDILKR